MVNFDRLDKLLDKIGDKLDSRVGRLADSAGEAATQMADLLGEGAGQAKRSWAQTLGLGGGDVPTATDRLRATPTQSTSTLDRLGFGGGNQPASLTGLLGSGTPISRDRPTFARLVASMQRPATPETPTSNFDPGADPYGATEPYTSVYREVASQHADINQDELVEVARALTYLESRGVAGAQGVVVTEGPYAGQRAQGLMQVMPGNAPGANLLDPRTNIQHGMRILTDAYRTYRNWDKAVAAYFGAIDDAGNITGARDDNGTDGYTYVNRVRGFREQVRNGKAGGSGMASIWGGIAASVTQQLGAVTPGIDQGIYGYGREYGLPQGHTGLDVGLKRGTRLYVPMGGTVQIAGGSGVFKDEDYGDNGNQPGRGELRILLDNGMVLILGHTSQISVKAGQRVTPGQLVGLSGSASGDHLHLELRIPDSSTPSGWRIVDPRQYLR